MPGSWSTARASRTPSRPSPGFPSRSSRRSPGTRWAAAWSWPCAPISACWASSAKVGQPEILLGVIPGAGGTQRLPRLIGPSRAKDLVYSGRVADAAEALRIGLADQVVPDAEVYEAARQLAARYTGGAPLALRAAKQAIDEGLERDLDAGLEIERLHFTGLFGTEDQQTGMRSFLENGPGKATFSGR